MHAEAITDAQAHALSLTHSAHGVAAREALPCHVKRQRLSQRRKRRKNVNNVNVNKLMLINEHYPIFAKDHVNQFALHKKV
jgi:hypothetical protein